MSKEEKKKMYLVQALRVLLMKTKSSDLHCASMCQINLFSFE